MKIIFRLILIFLLSTAFVNESLPSDSLKTRTSISKDIINDAVIFAEDAGAFFSAPFRYSGEEWFWSAVSVNSIVGVMTADREVKKLISGEFRKTYNHDILDGPTAYGYVQYPSIAAGVMYGVGLFARSEWVRVTARLWMEGLVLSGVPVMALRYLSGRQRPSYSDDQWKFTWFQTKGDTESFPSGHTAVAFATSTVLAERIDNIFVRILLYGVAALTGYTRLRNSQHWLSDIFVGAFLGTVGGWYAVHREKERKEIPKGKSYREEKNFIRKFSVRPSLPGFTLSYRF